MPGRPAAERVGVGVVLAPRELVTISGERVRIPDPDRLVHLQFRRFAGCPFCNLHLRSIVARYDDIVAAGIREVVVFHSTGDALRAARGDEPLAVVADPDKRLYSEFGVEPSPRAVLDPRAWPSAIRGVARWRRPFAVHLRGGLLGLPADFLIAADGRVLASKHGVHAYDQWSVEELLDLAARSVRAGREPAGS